MLPDWVTPALTLATAFVGWTVGAVVFAWVGASWLNTMRDKIVACITSNEKARDKQVADLRDLFLTRMDANEEKRRRQMEAITYRILRVELIAGGHIKGQDIQLPEGPYGPFAKQDDGL